MSIKSLIEEAMGNVTQRQLAEEVEYELNEMIGDAIDNAIASIARELADNIPQTLSCDEWSEIQGGIAEQLTYDSRDLSITVRVE